MTDPRSEPKPGDPNPDRRPALCRACGVILHELFRDVGIHPTCKEPRWLKQRRLQREDRP